MKPRSETLTRSRKLNRREAFTLIGLLVVLAIIAALTAILLSAFSSAEQKAQSIAR